MGSTQIWNEVLSPEDLTIYANHYLNDLQAAGGSLSAYFPDPVSYTHLTLPTKA